MVDSKRQMWDMAKRTEESTVLALECADVIAFIWFTNQSVMKVIHLLKNV